MGTAADCNDLQPGDLVFFHDPSRSNGKACAGIYVVDGEFIRAASGVFLPGGRFESVDCQRAITMDTTKEPSEFVEKKKALRHFAAGLSLSRNRICSSLHFSPECDRMM